MRAFINTSLHIRVTTIALMVASGLLVHRDQRVRAQSPLGISQPWSCWAASGVSGPLFRAAITDPSCVTFPLGDSSIHLAPLSTAHTVRLATPLVLPGTPTSLSATVSGQTVVLMWTPPTGGDPPTSYVLEAGSATGRSDLAKSDTGSSQPTLTATAVPAGTYFVRVHARNANGTSGASNEIIVTVSGGGCATVPSPPTNLSVSVSGNAVTLTWQPPSSGCSPLAYQIEAGSGSGLTNLANFSTGSSATTLSASGVGSGTYFVRVRSITAGGSSAPSNEVQFSVGSAPCSGPPSAPANLTSSVNGTTVVLSWTAATPSPSSYIIEAGSAPGLTDLVVSDTGSMTTSLTAPAAAGVYYVRVRARNTCGAGSASNEVIIRVGAGPLQASFAGTVDQAASPDSGIAASPTILVITQSSGIFIRQKTGSLVASAAWRDFFRALLAPGEEQYVSDPDGVFDPESGRFFVVVRGVVGSHYNCTPDSCVSHQLLAVSKSQTPRTVTDADWYLYALNRALERTPDGVVRFREDTGDPDRIVVVGNKVIIGWQWVELVGGQPQAVGGRLRVLDKSTLIQGTPASTWVDFDTPIMPRPAVTFGQTDRVFFPIRLQCDPTGRRETWLIGGLTNLQSSPSLTTRLIQTSLPCTPGLAESPQRDGGYAMNISHLNERHVYRSGHLWVAAATSRDFGSGPVSVVDWAELDMTGWPDAVSVVQAGTVGQDGVWCWSPALMVDASGNAGVAFARSGPAEFGSTGYTWRLANDPPGTMRPMAVLKAGELNFTGPELDQGRAKLNDFSGAAFDPDDGGIWLIGPYTVIDKHSGLPGASTWVGHLAFPAVTPPVILSRDGGGK